MQNLSGLPEFAGAVRRHGTIVISSDPAVAAALIEFHEGVRLGRDMCSSPAAQLLRKARN